MLMWLQRSDPIFKMGSVLYSQLVIFNMTLNKYRISEFVEGKIVS
jgi:hypothetical protein